MTELKQMLDQRPDLQPYLFCPGKESRCFFRLHRNGAQILHGIELV